MSPPVPHESITGGCLPRSPTNLIRSFGGEPTEDHPERTFAPRLTRCVHRLSLGGGAQLAEIVPIAAPILDGTRPALLGADSQPTRVLMIVVSARVVLPALSLVFFACGSGVVGVAGTPPVDAGSPAPDAGTPLNEGGEAEALTGSDAGG